MIGAAGLVVVAASLGYALLGGRQQQQRVERRAQAARGRRLHRQDGRSALSSDHSVTTPEGTSKKWNTSPPTSGPHYQSAGHLGRLHRAAAPGPGRAQPRARRHLHPVRQGRPAGDDRRAEGLLRQPSERDAPGAATRASARRSRSARGRRECIVGRTTAPRTSPSARRSTRRRTRRSSTPTSSRGPSGSRELAHARLLARSDGRWTSVAASLPLRS